MSTPSLMGRLAACILLPSLFLACAGGSGSKESSASNSNAHAVVVEEVFKIDGTFTMLAPGDEDEYQIMAQQPVKSFIREGKAVIYNLSPAHYQDVQVSDTKGVLAVGLQLAPWTRTTIEAAQAGDVVVQIPQATNPILLKFAQIKVGWGWKPHNFDPTDTKTNWMSTMTGAQLRGVYTLNYNMAHFISSPAFEEEILSHAIILEGNYADNAALVQAMRASTKVFNNWIVDGTVSGLGGGTTLGLGANQPVRHVDPILWAKGGMYTNTWMHEFSHCFGFSHGSNMTYGQDADHPEIPNVIENRMIKEWKERDGLLFPALKSPAVP